MAWTVPASGDPIFGSSPTWVTAMDEIRTAIREREVVAGVTHGTLTVPSSGDEINASYKLFIDAARLDITALRFKTHNLGDSLGPRFLWTDSSYDGFSGFAYSSIAQIGRFSPNWVLAITELQDILDDMKYYTASFALFPGDAVFPSGSGWRDTLDVFLPPAYTKEDAWDDAVAAAVTTSGFGYYALGPGILYWASEPIGFGAYDSFIAGPKFESTADATLLTGTFVSARLTVETDAGNMGPGISVAGQVTVTGGAAVTDTYTDTPNANTFTVIDYGASNDPDPLGNTVTVQLETTTAEPAGSPGTPFDTSGNASDSRASLFLGPQYGTVGEGNTYFTIRVDASSLLTN